MPKEKKEKPKKVKGSGKGERFADMSVTAVVIDEKEIEKELRGEGKPAEPTKKAKIRGKNYQKAKKMIDQNNKYPLEKALELLKKASLGKFNGTIEVHLNMMEKGLSGSANLPYFKAKAKKVVIFNDNVGKDLKAGKIDFDVLLASLADMPKILPFAKLLGPKGLMPNPKNGTLVPDPHKSMANFSSTAIHFKTEKDFPLIHTVIGKSDQPIEELIKNFQALVKAIGPAKIKKAVLKSTMSPGVKVAINAS